MGLIVVYFLVLIELTFVGFLDFKYKKISNYWSLLNLAFYIFLLLILPEYYVFSWKALFFPLVFFVITFILYLMKIMGAGDSKFLFTFYLIIPETYHEEVFICQAWLTIAVGGSLLLYNTIKNFGRLKLAYIHQDITLIKDVYGKKFAYAPVILGAWIFFGILRSYEG